IVVGAGLSSVLRVYRVDGALVASVDVGGVNTSLKSGGLQASPALADLNGDGVLDVTVASTTNVLAAYSFKGGSASQLWRRQDPPLVPNGPTGMIATPAMAFMDADDARDVVTASWGQALGAHSGRTGASLPGWPKWLWDTLWSSPAVGDVDGDGVYDVVVGGDCEGNSIGTQPCGATGGGYVWAFNRDGTEKWRWFLRGQVVWSSPALADLNGDGAQDVVVGSGGYWGEPNGRVVTALNGKTGTVLWQAATPARVVGSPSLADVTGDGKPDVFVVTHGGYLVGLNGANGQQLWSPRCLTDSGSCGNLNAGTKTGVALADIDGDGSIEAITQGEQRLRVYDARTGTLEAAVRSAYSGTIFAPANSPTVAQVNGQTWIVQPVRGRSSSGADELVVTVFRTGSPLGAAPWPTFKQNSQRTGAAA
ncbi:MAG TPA: FG-GAP-like repeat-containing protein, partial [Actinotalea sp.]|nr:FG-GAP-like repeat-containing protein [Actinotalea sp.]